MEETWLRCRIDRGMFSDELTVIVTAANGEPMSVFIPREFVQGNAPGEGRVRVRIVREDQFAWAVLPDDNQTQLPIGASRNA